MAHKELAKKLDSISYEELGVAFDEGLIWERLEAGMSQTPVKQNWSWLIAASLFLGVLLLPLSFLKKDAMETYPSISVQTFVEGIDQDETILESVIAKGTDLKQNDILLTNRSAIKSTDLSLASTDITIPAFEKVEIRPLLAENTKPQFAAKDLSVIQANLDNASFNDQRLDESWKLSISAQWQSSAASEVNDENVHAFKLRLLNAREKSQE